MSTRSAMPALLWLLFLLALASRLAPMWHAPPFSPDSWSYWELAQGIGQDFYRIRTWRQFQFTEPYGVSFPPLWPLAIAGFDALAGLGFRSAVALNALIAIATAAVLQRFCARFLAAEGESRASSMAGNVGLLIAIALIAHRSYFEELSAGRSMPLSLLLLIALCWQLLGCARAREAYLHAAAGAPGESARFSPWLRAAALGATAALATLNRFDFLPALLVLGLAVPFLLLRTRCTGIAPCLAWWTAAAAVLAPWAAWGSTHFGRLFVSDNSRTVLSAVRVYVDDFFVVPPPTLFDAPAQWFAKTLGGALASAGSLVQPLAANLLLLALLAVALLHLRARRGATHTPTDPLRRGWWLADLAVAAQLGSVLLTGFTSIRYALPLELYLLLRTGRLVRAQLSPHLTARVPAVLAAAVALQFALLFVPGLQRWLNPNVDEAPLHAFAPIADCLRQQPGARVLFLTDSNEHAYRFGALYGVETLATPHNFRDAALDVLVRRFGATHVYNELAAPLPGGLATRLDAALTPACGRADLFRIDLPH